MYIYIHTYMYTYISKYIFIYIYIHIYIHTYIYIHIYIHIYTALAWRLDGRLLAAADMSGFIKFWARGWDKGVRKLQTFSAGDGGWCCYQTLPISVNQGERVPEMAADFTSKKMSNAGHSGPASPNSSRPSTSASHLSVGMCFVCLYIHIYVYIYTHKHMHIYASLTFPSTSVSRLFAGICVLFSEYAGLFFRICRSLFRMCGGPFREYEGCFHAGLCLEYAGLFDSPPDVGFVYICIHYMNLNICIYIYIRVYIYMYMYVYI